MKSVMEGVRKLNPFYWIALHRLNRSNNYGTSVYQGLALRPQANRRHKTNKINPFNWSHRAVRTFVVAFFAIVMPVYAYIGMQPVSSIEAAHYPKLTIGSIDLDTPVAALEMVDHQLIAPAKIAGSYHPYDHKTLIIGHSSTVFTELSQVSLGDVISYADNTYQIDQIETVAKSEIDMSTILAPADTDTLILMTCAGEPLPDQDATHRLIVTAHRVTQ